MANKSFKISGQLDISNIISNTEKLRNALKSSLDTASFQKIEKEFDKFVRPSSKATGNYTWDTNGYEIEITYHEIDDDLYPGTNFILFTKKK